MSRAAAAAAVAIAGLAAGLAPGAPAGARSATGDQARHAPATFIHHAGRATRRRLPVTFGTSICADRLQLSQVRQGRRSVALRIDEVFDDGGEDRVCPEVLAIRCVTVVLARPLGSRRVVDLARGERVRRRRADDPEPAPQGGCPRAGRPPAPLPYE